MESSTTTSGSSTVTESCISSQASKSNNVQLLEISLISAKDLASVSKSMQTYAVTWINPNRKRTTQTDPHGHKNPDWTEKFIFRLDKDLRHDVVLTTEIYSVSWFRDVLVGTVRIPVHELIAPLLGTAPNSTAHKNMHFVTLQVRRPSGAPQGKLNMGVALLDSTMRSMSPSICTEMNSHHHDQKLEEVGDDQSQIIKEKIHLWRSMSAGSSDLNWGSVDQGGSEICSDIGPSASMVGGEIAKRRAAEVDDDTASSILEVMTIEEAKARGYFKVRREEDGGESEISRSSGRSRRKSDGGLFSCIAYGMEFTIVCGANKKPTTHRKNGRGRSPNIPSQIHSA